jgi:hypothetical protein
LTHCTVSTIAFDVVCTKFKTWEYWLSESPEVNTILSCWMKNWHIVLILNNVVIINLTFFSSWVGYFIHVRPIYIVPIKVLWPLFISMSSISGVQEDCSEWIIECKDLLATDCVLECDQYTCVITVLRCKVEVHSVLVTFCNWIISLDSKCRQPWKAISLIDLPTLIDVVCLTNITLW